MVAAHGKGKTASLFKAALALAAAAGMLLAPPAATAQGGFSMIRDAEVEDILRQEATPIFKAAGLQPESIEIYMIGDKELNAFVAGGQRVFLNTGLIVRTKNPNELMGVIAHETGHIAGGHLARSDEGSKGATATYLATMGLGILAALSGAPDAAAGLMYSSGYFATLNMLGYTRTQESAADQAAAKYLEAAGVSGRGLVDFFDNFRFQEVFSDARRAPYFRSHPISSQRIDALQNVVKTKSNYDKSDPDAAIANHAVMVAKLKGFINFPQQTLQDYPDSDQSFPARYARAIAAYRDLKTEDALKQIEALIVERPDNPYLQELKGQVLYESGRIKESEAPHRRAVELKADSPLLKINLGQTLVALDDDARLDEAVKVLRSAVDQDREEPMAWRLLSQAYDRKQEPGLARLAAAEQNFALGQLTAARDFAGRAREQLSKDTPEWRRANDIVQVADAAERDQRRPNRGSFTASQH